MSHETMRVRIAPSPTGVLHIGTARTALFNYLFAKKHGAQFVVRIEDTDKDRSQEVYTEGIIDGLTWLGITWDEGVMRGADGSLVEQGAYGPYRQSARAGLYRTYLERMLEEGSAFWCFHTAQELEARKEEVTDGPLWSSWRDTPLDEAREKIAAGEHAIIRLKAPRGVMLSFNDPVRGDIQFSSDDIGDISLARDLDNALYNFAVVVDDETMHISHVIRGDDHISNTPKQILIQRALGFSSPHYTHLPLILGPDKKKLSKRFGAASVMQYRDDGYLPEALINFIALLGWHPPGDREYYSLAQMSEVFDITAIQKAGGVFNPEKLLFFNAHYLHQYEPQQLIAMTAMFGITPIVEAWGYETVARAIAIQKERATTLLDVVRLTRELLCDTMNYDSALLIWKKSDLPTALQSLQGCMTYIETIPDSVFESVATLETSIAQYIAQTGLGNGEVLWPLRVALSGLSASPSPFELLYALGKTVSHKRIAHACSVLAHRTITPVPDGG